MSGESERVLRPSALNGDWLRPLGDTGLVV